MKNFKKLNDWEWITLIFSSFTLLISTYLFTLSKIKLISSFPIIFIVTLLMFLTIYAFRRIKTPNKFIGNILCKIGLHNWKKGITNSVFNPIEHKCTRCNTSRIFNGGEFIYTKNK